MAYCIQADVQEQLDEERLIQLTDDEGAGVVNADRVDRAIADADAEIDSYLSKRYTVPLSPVPVLVRMLSVDLAVWNLYSRKGVEDPVRKERYQARVKLLQALGEGKATLGVDPEPGEGGQQIKTGRTKDDRIFTIGKKSTDEGGSLDKY